VNLRRADANCQEVWGLNQMLRMWTGAGHKTVGALGEAIVGWVVGLHQWVPDAEGCWKRLHCVDCYG